MSAFTGERLVPNAAAPPLWAEHMARYAFAGTFCPARRALDIGCGSGYGSAYLAAKCERVTAVDIAREAAVGARDAYNIPNLAFGQADATQLPFAPSSFDLVTSFEVIEHVAGWQRALDEVARVVAEDGVALISTPNLAYYTSSRGEAGPNPYHVHEFEYEEFGAELSKRFSQISVLLQCWTECLAMHPHRVFPPAWAAMDSAAGDPEHAHFFVAICAKKARRELPRSFVYVPRACNLLRERENHIRSLQTDLVQVTGDLDALSAAHRELNAHLDSQNRWALQVSSELDNARARIVQLQDELSEQQTSAQRAIDGLEASARQLRARIEETERELMACTERADRAELMLEHVRESRWVRAGRLVRVGPDIPPRAS